MSGSIPDDTDSNVEVTVWWPPSLGSCLCDVINLPEAWKFRPFEFLNDRIHLRRCNYIYRYDEASQTAKEVVCAYQLKYKDPRSVDFDFVGQDFYIFNIVPYTESLIPLTRRLR